VRKPGEITVLGVCPGMKSLSYCCVTWELGVPEGELIDYDVLRGSKCSPDDDEERILRRARAHMLILSVVIERHEPDLIAIAPVSIKEPPERTEAVAFELGKTAADYKVPVLVWSDKRDLFGSFPVGADSKGIILQRIENGVPGSRNRALAWSAIASIAGFERLAMASGAAGLFVQE
jgi:hypothetical protein